MGLIASVILILSFIIVYVVVIQIYSVLFRITGLTKEKAQFQAISLLTNTGFTTSESEVIVSDRVRRRIALAAMITGYAFSVIIVSLIINVIISLKEDIKDQALIVMIYAFGAFLLLFVLTQIPIIKRLFEKLIEAIATKVLRRSKNENFIVMLDNYGRDAMAEVYLNRVPEFMVDVPLWEMKIKEKYHLNVMIVKRDGKVLDVNKDTVFKKGDRVVVFGATSSINNVFHEKKREQKANVIDLIEEYGEEAMTEIQLNTVPDILINKGLFESGLKSEYSINLLTIRRKEKPVPITKDTMLQAKDFIVVFGPYANIKKVFNGKSQ